VQEVLFDSRKPVRYSPVGTPGFDTVLAHLLLLHLLVSSSLSALLGIVLLLRCYVAVGRCAPRPPTQRWGSLSECVLLVVVSGTLKLDGFLPSL
jgi:hypothetical protein